MEIKRIKLVLVGALLASGGIAVLIKDFRYQMNGIAATANVLELKSECFVSRLQPVENKWSHETIDCKTEPALKSAAGSDKNIQVLRNDTAEVSFPLQDGSLFKTMVNQQRYTRNGPLHIGDSVPVIYDPKAPATARAPLGFLDVCVSLAIFLFGAVAILIGLKFNVKRRSDIEAKRDVAPARPPANVRASFGRR